MCSILTTGLYNTQATLLAYLSLGFRSRLVSQIKLHIAIHAAENYLKLIIISLLKVVD